MEPYTTESNKAIRKRTHLKSNQVAVLQESFNLNPLPDSTVRLKLANELSVTERTIQIWFQNKRAKVRKVDPKPSNLSRSSPPKYQATFRTMMTPERFEELKDNRPLIRKRPRSCSKPEPKSKSLLLLDKSPLSNTHSRAMSEGIYPTSFYTPQPQMDLQQQVPVVSYSTELPKSNIMTEELNSLDYPLITLPVSVIRIGSWTRFGNITSDMQQKDWDLVCVCNPISKEFIWRVQTQGYHFRIQIGFHAIQQIKLEQQLHIDQVVGELSVELNPQLVGGVIFSMWRVGQDTTWVRCGDFTEDRQASIECIHLLQGHYEAFKQSLLELIPLAPELASKISLVNPLEKSNVSNLMLQAPFFYPQQDNLYQMMLQQQFLNSSLPQF